MDPTRWKRRNDVLQSMLDLSADRREVFRREACAEDEALERDVRSLLEADRQAAGFLERPAMDVAARALANAGELQQASDLLEGRTVSHYRVIEKLGGGGI